MAFHYLIDGYNVIYAWAEIPPGSLQAKRQFLLDFIKKNKPQGRNAVTVIFDSREGSGSTSLEGDTKVVFTAGGTADDWISDQVRREPNPRSLVVVSNDKGIQHLIKGTGARFVFADEFLKNVPRAAKHPDETGSDMANGITDELREKWKDL